LLRKEGGLTVAGSFFLGLRVKYSWVILPFLSRELRRMEVMPRGLAGPTFS